jgi:cell division protease FtsH
MTRGRAPPAPRRAAPVGVVRRRAATLARMADSQPRTPAPTQHRHGFRVEGHDPKPEPKPGPRMPGGRRFWVFLLGLLVANYVIAGLVSSTPSREQVPYSYFLRAVKSGNVSEVTATGDTIQGTFKHAAKAPHASGKPSTRFQTERPSFADDSLGKMLEAEHVVINANPIETAAPLWQQVLFDFGPTLLIVGVFVLIFRGARRMGAGGALGGFGRSRAKRYEPDSTAKRVTFEDVAGIDEAEEELVEVVDFLRNPDRYTRLGATVPKGVLLSGLPGTGKTLLARAVAGEAAVPFFSISASEFIEAIVGVGASRVRDLFAQAKLAAPAIVFIDELDAVGRARGGSTTIGGHDEREQTLNQILTEMDGFSGTEGVIVIASTNRPEVLDSALLRPGRFDRRVTVNPPDQTGRRQILEVHTRGMPLGPDVDLDSLASSTPGMVGADLRNLVNESALTAARRNHDQVLLADFTDSLERIVLGAERRIVLSAVERERTAYHESGHALLGMLRPGADPVRKISIIPRGMALGVTFQSPTTDRYGYTVDYLLGRLVGALGGRAAEQLVYGEITTGAESDLEQATRIARQMAGRWGMSERIGPVSVLPGPNDQPTLFPGAGDASERTREMVDEEVRRILEECERTATSELKAHRDQLEALTRALLEHETLDEADAYRIAGIERAPGPVALPPAPVAAPAAAPAT